MSEVTLQAIVVVGMLALCIGVPLSLILTIAGKRSGPVSLRINLLLGGLFLSFAMVLALAINAGFVNAFSSLQKSQWQRVHTSQMLACIPTLVGLLSFFSGLPAVAWIGRAVVYLASPWALHHIGLFDRQERYIPWAVFYLVAGILCWEALVSATRRPRNDPGPTDYPQENGVSRG